MTTRAGVFNPAQFKAPIQNSQLDDGLVDNADSHTESGGSAAPTKKEYPVTGNATRDQVRKLIFESFQGDAQVLPNQVKTISQLVQEIEDDIFEECKDAKSKQYRDKSRAVQMKLKGTRFEQSRIDLRNGAIDSKVLIRDDYIQGKAQSSASGLMTSNPIQMPSGPRPPMMAVGPRPQMGIRPPGPGGPMAVRPRFPGPAPIYRPPPAQQIVQLPPQQIQESQHKIPESAPVIEPEVQQRTDNDGAKNLTTLSSIPFDDVPTHVSSLNQEIINEQEEHQQFQQLHPQPPSSTDVHIDERPQLEQEVLESENYRSQVTYQLDTSSTLIQTSIDNIGVSFEDEGSSIGHPGKKKGKKKKKKVTSKKPGEAQDFVGEYPEGQAVDDEGNSIQYDPPIIEEEKEGIQDALPEESGLRTQISEVAPYSGIEYNEIANRAAPRKQSEEEESFIPGSNAEATNQEVKIAHASIDERLIGIPSSTTNEVIRNAAPTIFEEEDGGSGGPGSELEQQNREILEEIKTDTRQGNQNRQVFHQELTDSINDNRSNNHHQLQEHDLIQPAESMRQQIRGQSTSSVKSHSSQQNNFFQPQIPNSFEIGSTQHLQNDAIKRLQDAISYKRAQKKELTEKLVHLENDCQLQQRKAAILLEENKKLNGELRQKDREIQNLKMQQDLSEQQLKLQIKTMERQLREKASEIEQLKNEVQRRKDKDERSQSQGNSQYQQLRDRQAQAQQDNEQQIGYLQNLMRSLEQRMQSSSGSVHGAQSNSNNNNSLLIEGAGASNYQQQEQMMESVQKEMREMKQIYEGRMRELNDQLQDRMRNLQRVERQNLSLQEKNIKLNNLLQNMEVQQLSTVAGSGSNQRDGFVGGAQMLRGMRGTEEEDDSRPRQYNPNNNNHPASNQSRYYQMIGENDEGTGGFNQSHMRNQQEYGYGEDGMAAPVVSGGGALGAGGGVGTTSAQLFNNDAYDDDEGFNEGKNQMRGGSGGVGSAMPHSSRPDTIGSGGGLPMEDVEEDEDQDLEEEGDDDDNEEEREEDYDHQLEGEGDYDGGAGDLVNSGAAGAGGLDEEDQEDIDEDAVGNDEDEEGFVDEQQINNEDDAEGGSAFEQNAYPEENNQNMQGRLKAAGAARGLKTHQNHNMQGDSQRTRDTHSGHAHSNSQYSQSYLQQDLNGSTSANPHQLDGGSYSSILPQVSGGARSTRVNTVRAAGPAAAGGTRRPTTYNNNEERKGQTSQGPRRGNKQQNQQHTNLSGNNATGSGGSSNMQNPRQRNTRGRQQRSNQQHIQQHLNQAQNMHDQLSGSGGMMVGATPSSNIHNRGQHQEYFQSYGDSSTHYPAGGNNNNNSRDQSMNQIAQVPAGGGVVHTVTTASRNTAMLGAGLESSMMSAESGSTALLDRSSNPFNRVGPNNNNIPAQSSGVATIGGQSRQHFQNNSSNNNQQPYIQAQQNMGTAGGQNITDLFTQDSSSAAPNNDSQISAAVGATPQSRAAAPRQQRHQHQQNNQQNAPGNFYLSQAFEESKVIYDMGGGSGNPILNSAAPHHSSTYSNNNQMPTPPVRNSIAAAHSGSSHQNNNQAQMQHNQYSIMGGSSGEQEEDSSSGMFGGGGAGSGMMASNHIAAQYGGSTMSHTSGVFERGRNQQPQPSGSRLGMHHDQSHNTPTRNDSRKTSGANTPNKDGADTPTTKAYRHQQNPFVQVHNLTSSHLFFNSGSNQDESENPFSGSNNNNQAQSFQASSNSQQQYGRSANNMMGGGVGGPSGGGAQEADVINPSLFDL